MNHSYVQQMEEIHVQNSALTMYGTSTMLLEFFFQKQLLLKQKRAFLVLGNTRSPSIKTSEDPVFKEKHIDEITVYL